MTAGDLIDTNMELSFIHILGKNEKYLVHITMVYHTWVIGVARGACFWPISDSPPGVDGQPPAAPARYG
jgi:hypothetical protein